MQMTIELARVRISRELTEAEDALADAMIAQSQLFTTLATARREIATDRFVGHDALLRLAKSQQSLMVAEGDLARVHQRLSDINRETGDVVEDCPKEWRKFGSANDLAA